MPDVEKDAKFLQSAAAALIFLNDEMNNKFVSLLVVSDIVRNF